MAGFIAPFGACELISGLQETIQVRISTPRSQAMSGF
jgi:hypothetical protein